MSGTYDIYLTGNYVIDPEGSRIPADAESDEDYDLSPDEDELELDDDESDELDNLEDPRITEIGSEDEEEVPKLVKKEEKKKQDAQKKGTNKRPAEDSEDDAKEGTTLDEIMSKSLKPEEPPANGEPKLSKKQLKKLKNNAGKAVETTTDSNNVKKEDSGTKSDKKVQFAKDLEQGPSSSQSTIKPSTNGDSKSETNKQDQQRKPSLGVKTVQGVKIDDKKLGQGPVSKKGDKLSLRYIGKLSTGQVFDGRCPLE